jgi:hypothetical protein
MPTAFFNSSPGIQSIGTPGVAEMRVEIANILTTACIRSSLVRQYMTENHILTHQHSTLHLRFHGKKNRINVFFHMELFDHTCSFELLRLLDYRLIIAPLPEADHLHGS